MGRADDLERGVGPASFLLLPGQAGGWLGEPCHRSDRPAYPPGFWERGDQWY